MNMSSRKLTIGVIFGGRSGEHEVSLVSARSIIDNLDKKKYRVVAICISKKGEWAEFIKNFPAASRIDVYFPMIHGTSGEDGVLQGLLELTGKPYVGCSVLASAMGMDKVIQKQIFKQNGLPVVPHIWFTLEEWRKKRSNILRRIELSPSAKGEAGAGYPCFVKPANLGSSVGVSKARNRKELISGILEALRYDLKILVEMAVEPARELEVSVLGNEQAEASAIGEIIPSNEFYDYDAKYVDGASLTKIPAEVPRVVAAAIQKIAKIAFQAIDGSGMARVDFLMNRRTNQIYLNEINTIPGFTAISMYPKLWAESGLPYNKLLDRLIALALNRARQRSKLLRSYEPGKRWWIKG